MSRHPRLGIVGGGRAAWAFGVSWRDAGWPLAGIALREGSQSSVPQLLGIEVSSLQAVADGSDLVLLAVPDGAIAAVSDHLPQGPAVFHCSGALSSDVLARHSRRFSLHPLRALPVAGTPAPLREALLVWEGSPEEGDLVARFSEACGCDLVMIPKEAKTLYHAAAVFSSNYVATMLDVSRSLMKSAGLPGDLEEPLVALARSAVDNWGQERGRARFTGPVARRDVEVIRRHIEALSERPELAELYRLLAEETARRLADDPEV